MANILQLAQTQGAMMIYLVVGVWCRKQQIINEASEQSLSTAIIDIALPCTIFCAMLDGLEQIDWNKSGIILIICLGLIIGSYFIGKFLFCMYPKNQRSICVFMMIVNNAAFIGLPLVKGTFETTGVFYTTIYMTVVRVAMLTLGLHLFSPQKQENPLIIFLKNPNSIAMFAAIGVYYILPFKLPSFIYSAVSGIGDTSSVFCMVLVGSLLTNLSLKDLINLKILYPCAIRLLAVPLLVFGVLTLLGIDPEITGVMTLLSSAPIPTLGTVYASKYQADKQFASTLVLVSTVFSTVTIPILALLYCM